MRRTEKHASYTIEEKNLKKNIPFVDFIKLVRLTKNSY